ncbi:MAG UNVERIFIED_CONTAM: hypothetical protein LVR29_22450 [Microcystis novacekii LVE1205-3]
MVKKFVTFENILKGEVIMKKFLIGIILWCSVAIQASEQGSEKAEKRKEKRQRAQSAGPLPVPVPVSPSGGLSPAAASPGSVQPNIGASASPTSPVILGVVQQAIEAEEDEIERLRGLNKPFRLFNRKNLLLFPLEGQHQSELFLKDQHQQELIVKDQHQQALKILIQKVMLFKNF